MYRIAICEDEAPAREGLCALCTELLAERGIPHEITPFSSAEALEATLSAGARFDLLCMDILMDGQSGIDFARQLRKRDEKTSVLFVTSSAEFLRDGYEIRPIHYLFKPVDRAQLAAALEADLRLHHSQDTVTIQAGTGMVVLPLDAILYVESRNHMAVAMLDNGEQSFRLRLLDMEQLLPKERFCRCHNSFLVNMSRIVRIDRTGLELNNGQHIPMGRRYCKSAQGKLIRFLNKA